MYQRRHVPSPRALSKAYRFLRLPLAIDVASIVAEIEATDITWLPSQWKWHLGTSFCILRGGQERGWPGSRLTSGGGIDAPALEALPRLRELLDTAFPARPVSAWLGLSPPDSRIHLHVDNTPHWDEHHRFHVPLITTPAARLCVAGRFLHLPAGTAWAFNNSVPHGAENLGPPRIHLMVDLPPAPAVEALVAAGTPEEGAKDPEAIARLSRDPMESIPEAMKSDAYLLWRLAQQ
ncbi:aspartyl/asparaginyl beta-hydroxylase domain-containing protein [Polyangium sp. 15x6]|uniref:aspartyl/asparaginyl beta-hydroxylase domain-containing protein n=1 Tax=Polyangium sp. 15x6 TaxID=3042687 RepID=UPI00249A82CA|nr:aspartyl/asparaginyl beta-hydroxylase domain-containing protein [Polyangium sp. 15x6]MDI3290089.1 aspartyl/asparaginyl beta-hydroxylase domain-containing protein [Polyangium sp. 15x6]